MFSIIIKRRAQKQLQKIQASDRQRLKEAIDALAENPFAGKKLDGKYNGFWSFRVWPYRIVYIIERKIITITIVAIGHRKDIYKSL